MPANKLTTQQIQALSPGQLAAYSIGTAVSGTNALPMNIPASYPMSPDIEDRTQPGIMGMLKRYSSIADSLWKQAQYEYAQGRNAQGRPLPAQPLSPQQAAMIRSQVGQRFMGNGR